MSPFWLHERHCESSTLHENLTAHYGRLQEHLVSALRAHGARDGAPRGLAGARSAPVVARRTPNGPTHSAFPHCGLSKPAYRKSRRVSSLPRESLKHPISAGTWKEGATRRIATSSKQQKTGAGGYGSTFIWALATEGSSL